MPGEELGWEAMDASFESLQQFVSLQVRACVPEDEREATLEDVWTPIEQGNLAADVPQVGDVVQRASAQATRLRRKVACSSIHAELQSCGF